MYRYQGPRDLDTLIQRAQDAINSYNKNDGTKIWFQELLDILKKEKYARIQLYTKYPFNLEETSHKEDFVDFVDVERISHTNEYASFFDIYNHDYLINFDFRPIEIEKLDYRLTHFYYKKYHHV
jgi:hypothetical protein